MTRTALVTGSFDPITAGHMYLIRTAANLFDKVYVTICANTEKMEGAFHPKNRLIIVEKALEKAALNNVEAILCSGLVSDVAAEYGARYLVRGVRNGSDFDYEYNLADIMKRFDKNLETIFLPTAPVLACISATYVRDLLRYGCPLGEAVPEGCEELIQALYKKGF